MFLSISLPMLILAGIVGTAVLFFFMEVMAPKMLGAAMRPSEMICKILGCSENAPWIGHVGHYGLGLIGFPIGFAIFLSLIPGSHIILGLIYGIILFLGAAMVIAPMAGRGFMFGGGKPLMAALIAHLAYGLVLGLLL